jgi:hypothetical protein
VDTRGQDRTISATGGRDAARDHVTQLRERGGTYRAIATAAGVGPMTVHGIATGRREPTGGTAAAVLAVTPAVCRAPGWTPAVPGCGCAPCT